MPDKQIIGEKIAWVAASAKTKAVFEERAKLAAKELGSSCIRMLPDFFHKSPPKPEEVQDQFQGLGEWMAICQAAIFEILYAFREEALPLLRRVAYGVYDWTQINAIDILCRLAMEDIEREQIDAELGHELPTMRYEAIMGARGYLARLTPIAPQVTIAYQVLIEEYLQDTDPVDALDLIEALVYFNPQAGNAYTSFLRRLMYGEGLANRSPVLDGFVVIKKQDGTEVINGTPLPPETHSIRAALTLLRVLPDDEEAMSKLREWDITPFDEL